MTPQEVNTFNSLSQSGEGEIICAYLDRIMQEEVAKLIESQTATIEDLRGARIARNVIQTLKDRLQPRGTIKPHVEHFS